MKKLSLLLLVVLAISGCARMGYAPEIKVSPERPLIATDIEPYFQKRAVVLAFREPVQERGLGSFMASRVLNELLVAGPFGTVGNAVNTTWFGLDPQPHEELSTAAAIGAELGYDVAIFGEVERFIYSRNTESQVVVLLNLVDTSNGRMLHQQRLIVRGHVGYVPPLWDPSNYKVVDREDLFQATVTVLVRRLHVRWWAGDTEADVLNPYQEDSEEDEGTVADDSGGSDG